MNNISPKSGLNQLSIIFLGLISGQVLFFVVAFFLVKSGSFPTNGNLNSVFKIVVPVINVIAILIGYVLYNSKIKSARSISEVNEKIRMYQGASIVRMASLEGANVFNIVFFLVTGNYFYIVYFVAAMAIYVFLKPSADKAIDELELSRQQADALMKGN